MAETLPEMKRSLFFCFKTGRGKFRIFQALAWKVRKSNDVHVDAGKYVCDCTKFRFDGRCIHTKILKQDVKRFGYAFKSSRATSKVEWAHDEAADKGCVILYDQTDDVLCCVHTSVGDLSLFNLLWLMTVGTTDGIRAVGGELNPTRIFLECEASERHGVSVDEASVRKAGERAGASESIDLPDAEPAEEFDEELTFDSSSPTSASSAWKEIKRPRPEEFFVHKDDWEQLMVGLHEGVNTLLIGPSGCHRRGTQLLRADGRYVRVEDVRVGDRLLGPSGFRNVLGLKRGQNTMYEIRPTKGDSFYVDEQHILTLVCNDSKSPRKDQLIDVSVWDYLQWSENKKNTHKLIRSEATVFENSFDLVRSLDPYFTGLLLGDGGLSQGGVRFTTEESNQCLIEYADGIAQKYDLGLSFDRKESVVTVALVGNKGETNPISSELDYLGLKGVKSCFKFIPDVYKRGSMSCRLAVLAGLLDADGHLHGNCYDYVSCSQQLAEDVAFVSRSLGLAAYVSEREIEDSTYWRVSISGHINIIPCKIPYKRAAARQQVKDVLRTGFEVQRVAGAEDYYGFVVDGDRRYLLADFTITHNCGKSELCYIASQAVSRELIAFNCGAMSDPRISLIGATHYDREKGTWFQESRFVSAVQSTNGVVLLDELTRATRGAFNILLPLLDRQGYLALDEREDAAVIHKAAGMTFLSTANQGAEYTGTDPIDKALKDRHGIVIDLFFPPEDYEQRLLRGRCAGLSAYDAKKLVALATQQRNLTRNEGEFQEYISTRMLLQAGSQIAMGVTYRAACKFCIENHFSADGGDASDRTKIRQIIQKQG